MTHKFEILYAGHYTTSYNPIIEVKQNFGFSIRNEFQDEAEFQQEPYLTMAKERIIKRLKKRGYTNIVITSIKAIHIHERKRTKRGINALAKRFLNLL